MNVLIVSSATELGGAERYMAELGHTLSNAGETVRYCLAREIRERFETLSHAGASEIVAADIGWDYGPEDNYGGTAYMAKLERQRAGLAAVLDTGPAPDFVLFNANWPTHYPGAIAAAAERDLAFGVHFHLCPHTVPLNGDARRAHAQWLPQARFLTSVSFNNRFFLENTFGRLNQFEVIANGSRFAISDEEREALASAPRERALLMIGRLDHQKGILDILPALRTGSALDDWPIHILGDGPLRDILARHAEASPAQIVLYGNVPDVADRLRRTEGFLLASHFEGMSLSILEAMSLGCIPIVSNASSAPEIITDGENGFLFEVGDWRSMADAIRRFDAADRTSMRFDCLERSKDFTRTSMLDTMVTRITRAATIKTRTTA